MQAIKFVVDPGWRVLLKDLNVNADEVLKRAQLPGDLFSRKDVSLSADEYFRLWNGMYETVNDPEFPLKLGKAISTEAFHPTFFAGLCSPNLNIAMERISSFKKLVGPLVYSISKTPNGTTISVDCLNVENSLHDSIIAFELVFITHFGRLGTREQIEPVKVNSRLLFEDTDAYTDYFGISITKSKENSVTFSAADAERPFVTHNEGMWKFFEPELRKRLSDLEEEESFSVRVGSSLLELLPSGQSTMDAVAKKLAVSKRTLQRRLSEESTIFNNELNKTPEKLARHYLSRSEMSGAQISFLLGFEEPSSFFRAFQSWTGQTPKQLRMQVAPDQAH